jgi:D-3-phosphoglycerate dehydrogenase
MPHIVISGAVHSNGLNLLRQRDDITIQELPKDRTEDLYVHLPEADALIIRGANLPPDLVAKSKRLKIVSRHGVGYDNIPVSALNAAGIPLTIVGDINSSSVAEHAFFMMIALAKRGFAHDRAVRDGDWNMRYTSASMELENRTLLIVGLGKIGRQLAKRALAFEMNVVAYDDHIDSDAMAAIGVYKAQNWHEALARADFVSLHVPRTNQTENMLGTPEFELMKDTAFVINASRGGLINEPALYSALVHETIAGAALDVFEREPPPCDSPFLSLDNLILSPHIAGLTLESNRRLGMAAARNVLDFLDGRIDLNNVVNKDVLV